MWGVVKKGLISPWDAFSYVKIPTKYILILKKIHAAKVEHGGFKIHGLL